MMRVLPEDHGDHGEAMQKIILHTMVLYIILYSHCTFDLNLLSGRSLKRICRVSVPWQVLSVRNQGSTIIPPFLSTVDRWTTQPGQGFGVVVN